MFLTSPLCKTNDLVNLQEPKGIVPSSPSSNPFRNTNISRLGSKLKPWKQSNLKPLKMDVLNSLSNTICNQVWQHETCLAEVVFNLEYNIWSLLSRIRILKIITNACGLEFQIHLFVALFLRFDFKFDNFRFLANLRIIQRSWAANLEV